MEVATWPLWIRPEFIKPIVTTLATSATVVKVTATALAKSVTVTTAPAAAAAVADVVVAAEIMPMVPFLVMGGCSMAAVGLAMYGAINGICTAVNWLSSPSEPKNDHVPIDETPTEEKTTGKCAMSGNGYESDSDDEILDKSGTGKDDGQKKKKTKIHPKCVSRSDDQFSSETSEALTRNDQSVTGALTGSYHLVRRLTRYLRLAGMATYIEHKTSIPRVEVFHPGASVTKDHICSIKGHNACHVVRLQHSQLILVKNLNIDNILRVFLGHTHCVHYKFNKCIGKEIDTLQGKMLKTLLCIDWQSEKVSELSYDTKNKLDEIKKAWLDLLSEADPLKYLDGQHEQLKIASDFIQGMSLEYLFDKILAGYVYICHEMNDFNAMNQSAFSDDIKKKLSEICSQRKMKILKSNKAHSY